MLHLHSLFKNLVPLVGLKADRGIILSQAVRKLTVARATHLKANPSVAKKKMTKKDEVMTGFFLNFITTYLLKTNAVPSMLQM